MQSGHLTTEQLSASLDGQLSEREARLVEAHLADCSACQRELAELRQTVALLQAIPAAIPRRSFRVPQSQAPGQVAPPPRWVQAGWLRALGGVAAALMVVVFAVDAVLPTARFGQTADTTEAAKAGGSQITPAAPQSDAVRRPNEALRERAAPFAAPAEAQPPAAPPSNQEAAGDSDRTTAEDYLRLRATPSSAPQSAPVRPGQVGALGLGLVAVVLLIASMRARRRGA